MENEENKETRDEENESENEEEKEDIKNLEKKTLSEIKLNEDGQLLGVHFDKENSAMLEKKQDTELYSNLYPITFNKDIQVCEYPFIIKPECHEESVILKILREASPELFKTYGYYYRSGNSFFALKCVEKPQNFKVVIHHRGWLQYTIFVKDTPKVTVIEKDKIMEKDKKKDNEKKKKMIYQKKLKILMYLQKK